MAIFDKAFFNTIRHEGGFVDDPDDPGGRTYMGITSRDYPDWKGWKYLKNPEKIPSEKLFPLVYAFYKENFWGPLHAEFFTQEIGDELFDTGVNLGLMRAGEFLQRGINLLNRNERDYKNVKVDGIIGPKTLATYRMMPVDRNDLLLKLINAMQANFYIGLMEANEVREKYIGWFKRV